MDRIIESLRKNILESQKETSKDGSQFLLKRNLKRGVILEL